MRNLMRFVLAAAMAALPLTAAANHWTGCPSTALPDESAIRIYGATGCSLHYSAATMSVADIFARINVTNTFDNNPVAEMPGWTTLELGYFDPGPDSIVEATLYRVDPCTGARTAICRATSVDMPVASCVKCTIIPAGLPIDFGLFLYYVEIRVDRAIVGVAPMAHTLRLVP